MLMQWAQRVQRDLNGWGAKLQAAATRPVPKAYRIEAGSQGSFHCAREAEHFVRESACALAGRDALCGGIAQRP